MIEAREVADLGHPEFSLADLRDAWQRTEFDLAADTRLVVDAEGGVVAFGIVEGQGSIGNVRPDAEGRGAGSLLLAWIMQRERERGHKRHRQYVAGANHSAAALLKARGYISERSNYRMARPLEGGIAPRKTEGISLRPPEAADAEAMHALDERAFAKDPDYVPASLTAFREEHLESHASAPDLSRVALANGQIVGFLTASRREEGAVGYVDILAVDPGHQGQGIGRALLLEAFRSFASVGLKEAQLGVSSVNRRALALYESAGMTPRFRYDIYERPIN